MEPTLTAEPAFATGYGGARPAFAKGYGEAALRALGKIVFGHPRWFATRPCLAGRDIDPMISTQGVRHRWQRYYTSLLLYPPFEPLASVKVLRQQLDHAVARVERRNSGF